MSDKTTDKTQKITLTGREPVVIREADWPIIATATWADSKIRHQANRTRSIEVRQHEDGRALVYGSFCTTYADGRDTYAGELIESGAEIPPAIRRVAKDLGDDGSLAQECCEDLPPEDLS